MLIPEKEKINESGAIVRTRLGEALLRTDFEEKLKEGEWISKHYGYIVEKLDSSLIPKVIGMRRP